MPGASPTSPPRRRLPEPRPPPCDRSGVIPLHLHRRPVLPPRVALRAARAALVAHQRAAVVAADQRRREVAVERRDVRVVDQRLGGSREALPAPRLRAAGYVLAYACAAGAVVAALIVAPWPTCAVLALAAVAALRWVLRVPLGGP